ncbi:hypothetical protein NLU13_5366 [Sarocladium strictum]|uniref:Terpene synthase n=1 Tax=Sarocladium strictum TaxID=5046 RepID=A0AA39GGR5_SARSR|nr:hypothetical protein NLU13_5366 [Sarocladium strictum]
MAQSPHDHHLALDPDLYRSPTPSSKRLSAASRIMRPPSSLSEYNKPKSLDSVLLNASSAGVSRPSSGVITPPSSPRMVTSFEVKPHVPDANHGPTFEIRLPDLFASIMSVKAHFNPNFKQVKPEADLYVARTLRLTPKQAMRNAKADFAFLVAWWAPNADAEALRTLIDWQHWAFPWDDMFDEGEFKDDLAGAAADIIDMTSILDDSYPPIPADTDKPIRYAFQQNWFAIRKRAGPSLQHRYKMYLKHYMLGVLRQVSSRARDPRKITVDEYLNFRRGTIGAMPCFCLVEYAEGIDLPQYVIDHPSIQACQQVAVDLVLMDNDVLSYRKDLIEGEELNLVNILRFSKGLTLQEAIDEIDVMLMDRYKTWYRALVELPSWGHKIDGEVLRYLDGCRNVALGSLIWSFHTGRYFKPHEGELVRREQKLWIAEELLAGIDGRPKKDEVLNKPEIGTAYF